MSVVETNDSSRSRFWRGLRTGVILVGVGATATAANVEARNNPLNIAEMLANGRTPNVQIVPPSVAVNVMHGDSVVASIDNKAFLPSYNRPDFVMRPMSSTNQAPLQDNLVGAMAIPFVAGAADTMAGVVSGDRRRIKRGLLTMSISGLGGSVMACSAIGPEVSQLTATPKPTEVIQAPQLTFEMAKSQVDKEWTSITTASNIGNVTETLVPGSEKPAIVDANGNSVSYQEFNNGTALPTTWTFVTAEYTTTPAIPGYSTITETYAVTSDGKTFRFWDDVSNSENNVTNSVNFSTHENATDKTDKMVAGMKLNEVLTNPTYPQLVVTYPDGTITNLQPIPSVQTVDISYYRKLAQPTSTNLVQPTETVKTPIVPATATASVISTPEATATAAAVPTPEKPPLSDTEMQKVVDGVNTRIAPMNLKLVKDASGNYFVSKDGTTHLTDNLTLLPSGEFQIKLSDGEQWKFSPADVLATLAANNMKDYQLHAAAWEIDQQTGAITWIPKEEIRDAPGSMFLASTETDIATAWRLHELPDSYLDTLFTGADTSIPWVITDIPSLNARTAIYPKGDLINSNETTLVRSQIPIRAVPFMYQLSDYNNISVFYNFVKQNTSTAISVGNVQTTSSYAQFLTAFDSFFINPSNPSEGIVNMLDPSNSGATKSSIKDGAGRDVLETFVPVAEFQGSTGEGWYAGTSIQALFPDDPSSLHQQERISILTDGVQSGSFADSYKELWAVGGVVAQAGK